MSKKLKSMTDFITFFMNFCKFESSSYKKGPNLLKNTKENA